MKVMKNIVMIMILLSHLSVAETAFDLTDVGISAESIAVGGIDLICETSQCIFKNPAAMSHELNWSADIFQAKTIQDVIIQNMSFSKSHKNYVLGIGYNGTSIDRIEKTLPVDEESGEIKTLGEYYSYYYRNYYIGGKSYLPYNISVGANLKYTDIELDDITGYGYDGDIGLMWERYPYKVSFGMHNLYQMVHTMLYGDDSEESSELLSANNNELEQYDIEKQIIKYQDGSGTEYKVEQHPFKMYMGASMQYHYKKLVIDMYSQLRYHYFNRNVGEDLKLWLYSIGTRWQHSDFPYLDLMLGYRLVPHLKSTSPRYALGLNINLSGFKLSYAFEKSETIIFDNRHYVSLSLSEPIKLKYEEDQSQVIRIQDDEGVIYMAKLSTLQGEKDLTFTLITGTFMTQKNAERFKKKQNKISIYPQIVTANTRKDGKLIEVYRLKLTEFGTLKEAKELKKKLNKLRIRNYILVEKKPFVDKTPKKKKSKIRKRYEKFKKKMKKRLQNFPSALIKILDGEAVDETDKKASKKSKKELKMLKKEPKKGKKAPKREKVEPSRSKGASPVMEINIKEEITVEKSKTKMGISGKASDVKSLSVNGQAITVRADNKFYSVVELPNEAEFELRYEAVGHNGQTIEKIIKVKREGVLKKEKAAKNVIKGGVLVVNIKDQVTIKKDRMKMGISGKASNIKSLSVNGQAITVRPDNKFYSVVELPNEAEFELIYEAVGINGKIIKKVIVVKRKGL